MRFTTDITDELLPHGGARRTVRIDISPSARYACEAFDHPEPYIGSAVESILQGLTERALGRCAYILLKEAGRLP